MLHCWTVKLRRCICLLLACPSISAHRVMHLLPPSLGSIIGLTSRKLQASQVDSDGFGQFFHGLPLSLQNSRTSLVSLFYLHPYGKHDPSTSIFSLMIFSISSCPILSLIVHLAQATVMLLAHSNVSGVALRVPQMYVCNWYMYVEK